MGLAVSAADANRTFSRLLGEVKSGRSYTITSHGKAVARLVPVETGGSVTSAARSGLFRRLKNAPIQIVGRWTRDELYEEPR